MTDRRHGPRARLTQAAPERTYLWRDIPPGLLERAYERLDALSGDRPPLALKWLLIDLLGDWLAHTEPVATQIAERGEQ